MKETAKPTIRIVGTKRFNSLHEKIKIKVAEYLRDCMKEVFKVNAFVRDFRNMLETVNPEIGFYIENEKKLFKIIETEDGKIAEHLGNSLADAAKWNPDLLDHIIQKMVNRVDGDDRLKIV